MKTICWLLILVLGASTGIMGYKFIWSGQVVPASDGRTAILLSPGERDLVLGEMRTFLESTQAILAAAANDSMDGVVDAARKMGVAAQNEVPNSLVGKLPVAFKKLGFGTHQKFDQLALDAEAMEDPAHTLTQLAELMGNCVACHATYRIDLEPSK